MPKSDNLITSLPFSSGTPGGSAERQASLKRERRERRNQETKKEHPVLGPLRVALSRGPRSTESWAKGAQGERKLGDAFERLLHDGAVVLHDRRIPGSKANIDHIVVSPAGIHIVDAKFYKGRVERRNKGGWFSPEIHRLYVGGNDRTHLVESLTRQILAVGVAASDLIVSYGTSIYPALCFVEAEWDTIFSKGFVVTGIRVFPTKRLCKWINRPGSLSPAQVQSLALRLAERLPEA